MINENMMNDVKKIVEYLVDGKYNELKKKGNIGVDKALVLKSAIDSYLTSDEKLTMPPDNFFQPKDFLENDMSVCELVSYEASKEKFSIYFDFWVNDKKKIDFTLGCMATVDDSGCANVIIDEIRLGSDFIDLASNNIL